MVKTVLDREDLVFSPPGLGCVLCLSGLPGGGSIAYDRSPHGNHGNVTGATWVRLPSGLWCLSFDGVDDYVSLSGWDNDRLGSDYTIEQWVKSDNLSVRGYAIGVVPWAAGAFYIRTSAATQKLEFSASGGSEIFSDTILSDDAWYHVVVQVLSGMARFYLNGKVDGSANSGHVVANTHTLYIGKGHGENEWDGLIGLTRIYRRGLSPHEIRRHFERERSLFGAW